MKHGPHTDRPSRDFTFSLRTLFLLTSACATAFAAFRWLGFSPRTSLFVSAIAAACLAAALALIATIAKSLRDEDRDS